MPWQLTAAMNGEVALVWAKVVALLVGAFVVSWTLMQIGAWFSRKD